MPAAAAGLPALSEVRVPPRHPPANPRPGSLRLAHSVSWPGPLGGTAEHTGNITLMSVQTRDSHQLWAQDFRSCKLTIFFPAAATENLYGSIT